MAGEFTGTVLGNLLSFANGRSSPERADGLPYPVYGSNGIIGHATEANTNEGSIIIGRVGSYCGSLYFSEQRCWVTDNAIRAAALDDNDPRFLFYLLGTLSLNNWRAGSGQPLLNQDILSRIPAAVPEPAEQRAIAHILGTLDDKIELNRRMNETLEAMARTLFKSWFVDFDPVRAKHALSKVEGAGGRPSTSSGRAIPGLPKPLADLFPDTFEDSELGEIPKGWKLGTLADFALVNPESWSKETRPDVINYVDLSNTKWGSIEAITLYKLRDAPSRAQRVLRPGDTIVGTVRPGNGSYAIISADGLTGSTGFAVLRPRRLEYAQFAYLVATAAENIETLSHLADGGAYPAVRPEVVIATQALRPGDKVLAQFSMLSDPLLAAMAQNECASRSLAALRDTLLPKIISGELRVKDTAQNADLPK